MSDASQIVGYRAIGRHGELGVIVAACDERAFSEMVVIRGGASDALLFLVPYERVSGVEGVSRTVEIDADMADFVPSLLDDGTVQLRLDPS